jgi:catechol-2,3-dioxygenase
MSVNSKAGIFEHLDTTILRVSDIVRSKKWYEEVLELKPIIFEETEKLVVYHAGNSRTLTIWQIKAGERLVTASLAGSFPIFYTKDINLIHDTLTARGVETEAIQGSQYVKFFGFYDPDQNRLEVCYYSL